MIHTVVWIVAVNLVVLSTGVVSGQDYPNKPIRVVTGTPGGIADIVARLVTPGLIASMGQQLIIENRGGENRPAEIVSKAPPDGYTLLGEGSSFWIGPLLQNTPYHPVTDFSPITMTSRQPNILVVHPLLPVNSVKELIAYAKAKPRELNYGSGQTGSASHLPAELFKAMAGVNIVRINYKGGGAAVTDLVAGQVQLMFATPSSVMSHMKAGRLKALAVTSAEPSALVPGLPTVAASGLPGYEATALNGMFAPAKTPAPIVKRLNQEIARVLNGTDVKEKFFNVGLETASNSPEEFGAAIRSDMARWGKVIKEAGIKVE